MLFLATVPRLFALGGLLLAGLLAQACLPGGAPAAAQQSPIDRLHSGPPLSSTTRTPAERTIDRARRQDLRSRARSLEREGLTGEPLSPTQRAQEPFKRGPGLIGEDLDEVRKDLKDLGGPEK